MLSNLIQWKYFLYSLLKCVVIRIAKSRNLKWKSNQERSNHNTLCIIHIDNLNIRRWQILWFDSRCYVNISWWHRHNGRKLSFSASYANFAVVLWISSINQEHKEGKNWEGEIVAVDISCFTNIYLDNLSRQIYSDSFIVPSKYIEGVNVQDTKWPKFNSRIIYRIRFNKNYASKFFCILLSVIPFHRFIQIYIRIACSSDECAYMRDSPKTFRHEWIHMSLRFVVVSFHFVSNFKIRNYFDAIYCREDLTKRIRPAAVFLPHKLMDAWGFPKLLSFFFSVGEIWDFRKIWFLRKCIRIWFGIWNLQIEKKNF